MKKELRTGLLLFLLVLPFGGNSQELIISYGLDRPPERPQTPPPKIVPKPEVADTIEIIEFPDIESEFPGGTEAMNQFIKANIQYPPVSIEMPEQGKAYVSFVVSPEGVVSRVKVERGVSKDLDREAKRIVRSMPNWIPGEVQGEKVYTRCRIPVVFVLPE